MYVERFYAEGGVPGTKHGNALSFLRTAEVATYEQAVRDGDAKLDAGTWAWFTITKVYVGPES